MYCFFHSERLPQSLLPECTVPPFCEATALCLKVQMKDEWTWAPSCMSLSKDKHLFLHKPIILAMITNCYALLLGVLLLMTLVMVPQLSGRNNWTGSQVYQHPKSMNSEWYGLSELSSNNPNEKYPFRTFV